MSNEYLKKDLQRVNKKFEELMQEGEIDAIEKKIEELDNPDYDSIDYIWIQIYNDVLNLKKKKKNKE